MQPSAKQVDYDAETIDAEPASNMPAQRHITFPLKKTRADFNRHQRKRDLEHAAQRREVLKKQRRDIDRLQVLEAEITEENAHVAARKIRRQVWACLRHNISKGCLVH